MKIDSTWTPILRQIDVDLMSVCSKILCTEILFWKDCVCIAIEIKCKHK